MTNRLSTLQQRLLLLVITLTLLGTGVGISKFEERLHLSLLQKADTQQLMINHCRTIKEELGSMNALLLSGETRNFVGIDKTILPIDKLIESSNLAVSSHIIQDNLATIRALQEKSYVFDRVTAKATRQVRELVSELARISSMDEDAGADHRWLREGLLLSMDQLIGLHSLRYRELLDQLEMRSSQEPRFFLAFVALLVLVSFVSSWWVVGLVSAVSKREKQAQLARERLLIELEKRNAELERFGYTISHDIRAPLITVKSYLGYVQKNAARGNTEEMNADIDRIRAAADRMNQMLDGLLQLSRSGRVINPPEEGSLTELVREAAAQVQDQIDERDVELCIEDDMPLFWGDRLRLRAVFQNLIQNAVKYMGTQPAPRIEVSAEVRGKDIVCTVRDNGIGIDPQYHGRIFDIFERVGQDSEGTGIGLALVKRIVEAHGGSVSVQSEGGQQGSAFTVVLPRRSADEKSG